MNNLTLNLISEQSYTKNVVECGVCQWMCVWVCAGGGGGWWGWGVGGEGDSYVRKQVITKDRNVVRASYVRNQ